MHPCICCCATYACVPSVFMLKFVFLRETKLLGSEAFVYINGFVCFEIQNMPHNYRQFD